MPSDFRLCVCAMHQPEIGFSLHRACSYTLSTPLPHSAATVVDTVGSAALVTMSLKSGVSLSISVNYISAMPGGEDAEIDARVVKVHTSTFVLLVSLQIAREKLHEPSFAVFEGQVRHCRSNPSVVVFAGGSVDCNH
jgi:Thioesterase superfamily